MFRYTLNIKESVYLKHLSLICLPICLLVALPGAVPVGGERAGVPSSTIENPVRVLLVSSTVRDAEILVAAARDDIFVIEYEARNTTLEGLLGDDE